MAHSKEQRRKHSSIDLDQVVTSVDEYKRPLDSSAGGTGAVLGFRHHGVVATTENGQLYLIEKGVSAANDINYQVKYREGECRIVKVLPDDIRDWQLYKSVNEVVSGLTLEDLFDACGSEYGVLSDNCWNGAHRMRARANPKEDGMPWQGDYALKGAAVAVTAAAAYGLYRHSRNKKKNNADGRTGLPSSVDSDDEDESDRQLRKPADTPLNDIMRTMSTLGWMPGMSPQSVVQPSLGLAALPGMYPQSVVQPSLGLAALLRVSPRRLMLSGDEREDDDEDEDDEDEE